ncbi:response regulator [Tumidithrix helvetica PCC 7403]|uniref:response regulator n=1 Tax=Tumidithrix helvetica TaxID=3457545 RepID=UPI003CC17EE2
MRQDAPRRESPTSSKPKLLVIDDEPDNLDLLYRTFYREYKVLRAQSGLEAIALLEREGEVAVIISDQRMPVMSGTEFLSQMAIQYPDTMRIILTAYTDIEDLVEAINSSRVFKYVTKPWEEDDLKNVVKQALETHYLLKNRTGELRRSLRQETLLNAIAYSINGSSNYRDILESVVEIIGRNFEVTCCIVSPFQDDKITENSFLYLSEAYLISNAEVDSVSHENFQVLAQTLVETRKIQIINDVSTDERIKGQSVFAALNVKSSLLVPLIVQQELIAVMALHQCDMMRTWTEDEVELINLASDQAALALSQALAYEQVQALAKREALVNTITTAIRSSLDPQDIFAAITQQLGQALQSDGCALSLWTEEDEYVHCVGLHIRDRQETKREEAKGKPQAPITNAVKDLMDGYRLENPQISQSKVRIDGNPVLLQLITTKLPVIVDDLTQQPQLNHVDLPLQASARSLLIVPLISDGKIIGSISLRQIDRPRHWQTSEVTLAQAVASQAAIAVQQARLYQKTREQAQQLIESDRQKTEFFQNISHEFRTPLTLTIGPLESAIAKNQTLTYDQSVIALRNCRRLLRLVNQLLDLQRLDAGKMQSCFRPCDLTQFAMHTLEAFQAYCDKKNLRLFTQFDLCPQVYLDLEKFDKVIYNLLSNAMKFTPSGGSITVRLQSAGDRCLLSVEDTGIGIRTDQIPFLFERFRQAEGSISRSYEGSGLGLSLVKELVELHSGEVIVDSIYGKGTKFTISLPIGDAHLPPKQVMHTPVDVQLSRTDVELAGIETDLDSEIDVESSIIAEENAQSTRMLLDASNKRRIEGDASENLTTETNINQILIVDDNADLRGYLRSILLQAGYQVISARNGSEGFHQAQKFKPDLIVTDLMMPQVSGLDLIRLIREDAMLASTPMILLTAKIDEETRIEGTETGADAYLAKPFNNRELLAEVRNLLALKLSEQRVKQLNQYLTESVLKRFLPPLMVQKAAEGQLSLDLRPEPRMITVLFSDIVGFTQLANTVRSRRVSEMLNQYLGEMTRAIFAHRGTVDKFMGDGILALFGAPEELSPNEQVRCAVDAAREMKRALAKLNAEWLAHGIPPVQFRCGIHQGTAVVGMFGCAERSDYTAIGPTVNIASRIQSAAEPDCILVSAVVADYLEEDEIGKRGILKLKGIDETVLTFLVHA